MLIAAHVAVPRHLPRVMRDRYSQYREEKKFGLWVFRTQSVLFDTQIALEYTQRVRNQAKKQTIGGCVFKRAAVEAALDVPPHLLRTWVEGMAPFSTRPSAARVANGYSLGDLAFLFVVKMLVASGFPLKKITASSEDLYRAVLRPVSAGRRSMIYLCEKDGWKVGNEPQAEYVTIQVPVWKAWNAVNEIVNADVSPRQADLSLGPNDISGRQRNVERRA